MSKETKPTLAEVALQTMTTPKKSKFLDSMIPVAPSTQPDPAPEPEKALELEKTSESANVKTPDPEPTPVEAVAKASASSRSKKPGPGFELSDILNAPNPGIRCTNPTVVSEKHHDLLRKIGFDSKKPITVILYNLLEKLDEAYQRDQQKDV